MLVYNDQKDSLKRYEEIFGIIVPEENFWRQLNRAVDFSYIYSIIKDEFSILIGKSKIEVIRIFKCLLLKEYYNLTDDDIKEKISTNLTFRYFLEYDPIEAPEIDTNLIADFGREIIDDQLINELISITVELTKKNGKSLNNIITSTNKINFLEKSKNNESAYTMQDGVIIFLENMKKIIQKIN